MIDGLIAGKLHGQPTQREGKSGHTYVLAKVRASTSEGESLFVNVIAFDDAPCAALLGLSEGDSVALSGTLTPRVWTDSQGQTRPSLDMVASQALTAYHVKSRRSAMEAALNLSASAAQHSEISQGHDAKRPMDAGLGEESTHSY